MATNSNINLYRLTNAVKSGMYSSVNTTATDGQDLMMNLLEGGYGGWSPKLGKEVGTKQYSRWISNQAHVSQNVIPIVLQYPKFFHFFNNDTDWIATYKAIMEIHPLTIEGLSSGLEVEFDEVPVGGGGEMQEEVVNVTRARSTVSYTFKERLGKPFQRFFDTYIRYGLKDPDTKTALVGTLSTYNASLYTADYMSGTVLFIEPDVTHRKVIEAWICTNMMPKSNGEVTGKRDKSSGGETLDLSIEFTSITLNNRSVRRFAQTILDSISIAGKDPALTPVFLDGKDANLDATGSAAAGLGYKKDVEQTTVATAGAAGGAGH